MKKENDVRNRVMKEAFQKNVQKKKKKIREEERTFAIRSRQKKK